MDEKSCGVVVFRDPQPPAGSRKQETQEPERLYLILHYEEGHWDFPKGHVERGEEEKETARREVREETGIGDLAFAGGFRERIEYFYRRDGRLMHKEVFFFAARTRAGGVKLSHEHVGYDWLPYEKALERLTYPNAKDILKKARAFLEGAGI